MDLTESSPASLSIQAFICLSQFKKERENNNEKEKRITIAVLAILLLSGCAASDNEETTLGTTEPTATTQAIETESQSETEAVSRVTPVTVSTKAADKDGSTSKSELCTQNPEKSTKSTVKATKPTTTASTKVYTTRKREPNTFTDYNNTPAYNDLITKTYDESDIVARYILPEYWGIWADGLSERVSYNRINSLYPVECIRKCGDHVYAIYKTKQGGLLYIFFDEGMDVKHCAYSTKKLSYSDFESVKAGQSVADIEKIDSNVTTLKKYWEQQLEYAATTHILTDGVLRIFYHKSPQTGEFTVWKTAYSKDFIFSYDTVFEDETSDSKLDYRILPSDYVN